jgi:cytochrome P450
MDPPEHTRLRQYANQFFTARLIDQLLPRIEQIAAELLAEMALSEPPVDLITVFTRPLPLRVISEMLGLPLADQGHFVAWMDAIMRLDATEETIVTTYQEMWNYFVEQLESKRRRPADDILSSLAQAQDDGRLSENEAAGLGTFLLGAGYDTALTVLTDATLTLLRHPAERAELIAKPELWPNAVEELLRLNNPGASLFPRLALDDVVLSDVLVPRGTTVLAHVGAACRDEAVLDESERFDMHREVGFHLFFGHGPHFCLGAPLARAELRIGLRRLFERFPGLSLAIPSTELRWQDLAALGGFEEFPVTW